MSLIRIRSSHGAAPKAIPVLAALLALPVFASADFETVPGATYVGKDACLECHEEEAEEFGHTKMGRIFLDHPRDEREKLACENCHGPGSEHAEDETEPGLILTFAKGARWSVEKQNQACLQCHEKGSRTFWTGSMHESRGLACVDCHTVMKKTENDFQLVKADEKNPFSAKRAQTETCIQCHPQRGAQMLRSSHMPLREGKMTCSDCHDPHGTATPSLLRAHSVNESCYSCHAEKRGPFLWEHAPVREDCTTCHDSHGSIHANLLNVKPPRLCQQCHIETRHPTEPHAPNEIFVFNRACMNCHSQIHGSNHPSGVRFMR